MPEVRTFAREFPVGHSGGTSSTSGWWGMIGLIATEASIFAYLFFSYYYLHSQSTNPWPTGGLPPLIYSIPSTVALLISGFAIWWAEYNIRRDKRVPLYIGLVVTFLLGILYIILQLLEWSGKPFSLGTDAYSSLYYVITGLHMVHAVAGIFIMAALIIWSVLGHLTAERHASLSIGALYWYFVIVVWIGVFSIFYIVPYISAT
jgi:heme/copper-type cytochrome/quinol oxidase subunit 3